MTTPAPTASDMPVMASETAAAAVPSTSATAQDGATAPWSGWQLDGNTLWRIAWTVAFAARCTLPEARASFAWGASLAIMGAGIVLLWWPRAPLTFDSTRITTAARLWHGATLRAPWALLCAGLLIPVVLGEDWLTQTFVLLGIAFAGLVSPVAARVRQDPFVDETAAPNPDEASRGAGALAADKGLPLQWHVARVLVALTYLAAAFHKLNQGFFTPSDSCAEHGQRMLGEMAPLVGAALEVLLGVLPGETARVLVLAGGTVGTEALLGITLLLLPRAAWAIAPWFHALLTVSLAPAFAFSVMPGWVAAWVVWRRALADVPLFAGSGMRARRRALVVTAGTLVAAACWHLLRDTSVGPGVLGAPSSVLLSLKLGVLTVLPVVALWGVWQRLPETASGASPAAKRGERVATWASAAAALVVIATPYLGTQTQHTGAMLSNLRIDEGCWNHLVVPESVRLVDPYLRITEASLGTRPGGYQTTVEMLQGQLWSAGALRRMRANWCNERTRPIRLVGTGPAGAFDISDLCDDAVQLPADPGVLGGEAWLPLYLRVQKNLSRTCPTACVH